MTIAATHVRNALSKGLLGLLIAAMATFGLAGSALAQTTQVLTEQQVTGFIASYPEIVALSEEFEGNNAGSGDDLAASFGALMKHQDAVGRLNATVSAHGFANYNEWIQVVGTIAMAYTYASQGGGMDAQMEAAMIAIRDNPNLTADQKKTMLAQFEQAAASMDASRPSQENIDLVNAHAEELDKVFRR